MIESFVITLREGVEAALVVAIIFAFLRRQGYERYLSAVWWGIATATAASVAGAVALYRLAIDEEVFEGLLYVASALLVGTFLVWMWRHSHEISGEMRGSLTRILGRENPRSALLGLFAFTFVMVFREGVETVLFLSAISLSTEGLLAWFGALAGLAIAVVFAVLFVRGSLRVDIGRFFTVTGIALLVFLFQLLLNGYHELSEAGWVPANPTTMGLVGPIVRDEFFFIAAVLALPLFLLMIPGREGEAAGAEGANPAAERLARARRRAQRRARVLGGVVGLVILLVLGLSVVYASTQHRLAPATPLAPSADGTVHVPLAGLADEKLHHYVVPVDGTPVRFFALALTPDDVRTAFDACVICGAHGYDQRGHEILCLHCASAIYPPSIGQPGGCNPIPLPSHRVGDDLVVDVADLASERTMFAASSG